MADYAKEELTAIYELGRMYYEMGYLTPAERVFGGLAAVDNGQTAARIGLALVKIERGLYQDAITQLRLALQLADWEIQVKLALCAAFFGSGEAQRAQSVLGEVARAINSGAVVDHDVQKLLTAFMRRAR